MQLKPAVHYTAANRFHRLARTLAANAALARLFALTAHRTDGMVLRLSRGRHTLSSLVTGLPVILLEVTGARSGQKRVTPLIGVPVGDAVIVVASNWGQRHHPAWYYNLRAQGAATITMKGERRSVRAREPVGDERESCWVRAIELYPGWDLYRRRAHREVPLIVLDAEPDGV